MSFFFFDFYHIFFTVICMFLKSMANSVFPHSLWNFGYAAAMILLHGRRVNPVEKDQRDTPPLLPRNASTL